MKVWKKLKVVVLTMLFCIGVMVQPALAATMVQDGIEATLTTDKENYQQGEEITVTLMVTNTNRTEATNVSLETFLPDHFVVAENNETAKQVMKMENVFPSVLMRQVVLQGIFIPVRHIFQLKMQELRFIKVPL